MAIVDMRDMLIHAHQNYYAIAAFEVVNLDFLMAIIDAAEQSQAPVILNVNESSTNDLRLLLPAIEMAARHASIPVAIHYDQGTSVEPLLAAINNGCNAVTIDSTVKDTKDASQMAGTCGVTVGGTIDISSDFDPIQARDYVELTKVDFLAISDMAESQQHDVALNNALNIPLSMNDAPDRSDNQLSQLVANGLSMLNCSKTLKAYADQLCHYEDGQTNDLSALSRKLKAGIYEEVQRQILRSDSAGRAEQVLLVSQPWLPVEHLIIYNVKGLDAEGVDIMMNEGRRLLAEIPGVRAVVTGTAIKEDVAYRYTWLVRFCHPAVIDSYREHPAHIAFADEQFRPVAGERISIDYQSIE